MSERDSFIRIIVEFSAGFYNHYSLNHSGKLSTIHLIKYGAAGRIYNHYSLNHSGKLLSIHLIKYGAAKGKNLLKRSTSLKDGEPKKGYSTTDQRDRKENQGMSGLCH